MPINRTRNSTTIDLAINSCLNNEIMLGLNTTGVLQTDTGLTSVGVFYGVTVYN